MVLHEVDKNPAGLVGVAARWCVQWCPHHQVVPPVPVQVTGGQGRSEPLTQLMAAHLIIPAASRLTGRPKMVRTQNAQNYSMSTVKIEGKRTVVFFKI